MHSETSLAVQPCIFAFGALPTKFATLTKPILLLEYRQFQHRRCLFANLQIIFILPEMSKQNCMFSSTQPAMLDLNAK